MTSAVRPADRGKYIWGGALALVVVIAIVAFIASSNGTSDEETKEQPEEVVGRQTAEVTVGTPDAVQSPGSTDAPGSADEPDSVSLPEYSGEGEDPAVGQVIPTVSGTSLEGEPLTISAGGKAKVMLFVAHWCPHCQREIPLLAEHLKDTPMPDDVELVTVSTGVAEERGNYPPSAWLENAGWSTPVLADSEQGTAAVAYGLSSFPYYVVVDAEGKVVARTSGELTTDQFDSLVAAAQAGRLTT